MNYKILSVNLGLHKDSYNFVKHAQAQNINKIKSIQKIQQMY